VRHATDDDAIGNLDRPVATDSFVVILAKAGI